MAAWKFLDGFGDGFYELNPSYSAQSTKGPIYGRRHKPMIHKENSLSVRFRTSSAMTLFCGKTRQHKSAVGSIGKPQRGGKVMP
jgi:hypothetical protein